jgi:heptosyltransferase-2
MRSSTTTSSAEPPRVLCVAPSWLGDAVLARGALARLGRAGVVVEAWARPRVQRVLEDLPGVQLGPAMPANRVARFAAALGRRGGGDAAALVLAPSWSAAAAASCAGARLRVGFDSDGRRALLTHALPLLPRTEALAAQYDALAVALLAALGRPPGDATAPPPLVARAAERAAAAALLGDVAAAYVVLAPGARYGPAKRWPHDRFAAAGATLARAWGAAVVLVGERADADATAAVRAALPTAVDLTARTTTAALIGVLAGARGVVANDSGVMHVAAALDRPVVGVFGSSDPRWTGPRGARAVAVSHPVWCAPCFAPTCREDFGCMLGVAPERVVAALVEAESRPVDVPAGS